MSGINNNQLGIIGWEEFEEAAKTILESAGASIEKFQVNGKERFTSDDGEYEIDASVEFTMLGGVKFFVIVECRSKKVNNKVKRDEVLAFHSKVNLLKAQKGVFFTTSGYQKGAIEYARKHSIALVRVVSGTAIYITKGMVDIPPLKWLDLPKYAGWLVGLSGDKTSLSLIRPEISKKLLK